MKCPSCNEEIPEGSLYCEHCGEDIHIVPDFEPALDDHIQAANNRMAKDIHPQKKPVKYVTLEEWDEDKEFRENTPLIKKLIPWFGALLVAILLGVCVGVFFHIKSQYTTEYILTQARTLANSGDKKGAIEQYLRIIDREDVPIEALMELAEVYRLNGQEIQYENQLWDVLRHEDLTDLVKKNVYERLINIYMGLGDYAAVAELSKEAGFQSLDDQYAYLQVSAPECNLQQGYYDDSQLITLSTSDTDAVIYYSLDGSDPSASGEEYTTPILLESGNYLLQAVCLNSYNLYSSIATWEFHISDDTATLPIPEINLYSGYFTTPQHLEVVDTDNPGKVYYTKDGTVPNELSDEFTSGEWLTTGESQYKFIRIDAEGHKSLVLERIFHLSLDASMTVETGRQLLLIGYYNIGFAIDQSGNTENGSRYDFEFQYPFSINGVTYYLYAEKVSGTLTGNFNAVNVATSSVCGATVDGDEILLLN